MGLEIGIPVLTAEEIREPLVSAVECNRKLRLVGGEEEMLRCHQINCEVCQVVTSLEFTPLSRYALGSQKILILA